MDATNLIYIPHQHTFLAHQESILYLHNVCVQIKFESLKIIFY